MLTHQGGAHPAWEINLPLLPHIPNILAVKILPKTILQRKYITKTKYYQRQYYKNPLIAFYKLFLGDIKVKILINSWHF